MESGKTESARTEAAESHSERDHGARALPHTPSDHTPPSFPVFTHPTNGLAIDSMTGVTLERLRQEHEQSWYSELQLLAPSGYFLIGFDSTILRANIAGAGMLGIDRTNLNGARLRDFVSPRFSEDFERFLQSAINDPAGCTCMLRLQPAGGGPSFHVTLRASADPGGQACRVVAEFATGAQENLARSEERFRRMVHMSSEGMWELDADGLTTFVNPRMAQMMGYRIEDMIGRERGEFMDEEGRAMLRRHQARRREGEEGEDECKFVRKDGSVLWVTMATTPIFDKDGNFAGSLALAIDITEQKKSAHLAWRQANYDALTGLPNRHMFLDRLDNEMRKVDRGEGFLALLFIDLDHFKQVNDELGHAMGDLLLVEAARRIGHAVRTSDTLSRLGGDEFTAILPGLHLVSAADRIAQAVIAELAQPFELHGHSASISASVGIALYPDDASNTARLLECADQAMYASKKAGRNCYSYFTQDLQDAAMARLEVASSLREAVREHQFEVLYQPIVSLSTGELCKAEALLRWRHPRHGLLSPAAFMAYAESSGMILEIGDWAFRQAARQAAEWRGLFGDGFQVSVNKSAVEFRRAWQLDQGWMAYIGELGLPPGSLLIEIKESVLLDEATSVQDGLREYQVAGVQVALDDFGTGYSSMAHLNDVVLDYIKIDPDLVRRIEAEPAGLALCQAIVAMARKLGLKVVAEGVENGRQRDLLFEAGCDFAQGYMFAAPMPAHEVAAFGERRRLH